MNCDTLLLFQIDSVSIYSLFMIEQRRLCILFVVACVNFFMGSFLLATKRAVSSWNRNSMF